MPLPSITKISLKITCLRFHSNFPGANVLTMLTLPLSPKQQRLNIWSFHSLHQVFETCQTEFSHKGFQIWFTKNHLSDWTDCCWLLTSDWCIVAGYWPHTDALLLVIDLRLMHFCWLLTSDWCIFAGYWPQTDAFLLVIDLRLMHFCWLLTSDWCIFAGYWPQTDAFLLVIDLRLMHGLLLFPHRCPDFMYSLCSPQNVSRSYGNRQHWCYVYLFWWTLWRLWWRRALDTLYTVSLKNLSWLIYFRK